MNVWNTRPIEDALQSQLAAARHRNRELCGSLYLARTHVEALQKDCQRIKELEADKARLDWLEQRCCFTNLVGEHQINCEFTGSLRQAIDSKLQAPPPQCGQKEGE